MFVVDPMGMWMMRTPPNPDASRFKRDLDRGMSRAKDEATAMKEEHTGSSDGQTERQPATRPMATPRGGTGV